MKTLYLGPIHPGSTARHRADALRRLGLDLHHCEMRSSWLRYRILAKINFQTGNRLLQFQVRRTLQRALQGGSFDLCWIDGGGEIGPAAMNLLRRGCRRILVYNHDDPFGSRDGRKWDLFRRCVPMQDHLVVVRQENIEEAFARGCPQVIHVFRPYDPVAHAPFPPTEDLSGWASEVAFVGTWMPERGPFMKALIEAGLPLSIWGDRWQKAKEWPTIARSWRGPGLLHRDYVRGVQGSRIALGLLSKGNRDLHTQRSAEVPFIGGAVLCAERTPEHERLYADGVEAVFWSSAEECVLRCRELLADEPRRRAMAEAARQRVMAWRLSNDEVMAAILRVTQGLPPDHPLVEVHPAPARSGQSPARA